MSVINRISEADVLSWSQLMEDNDHRILLASCGSVSGPISVSNAFKLRRRQLNHLKNAKTVPCDIHALGIGESVTRSCTRIGGLPFRPRSSAWPATRDCAALTFVCQFNLHGSSDILPELPGDLLLVYSDGIPMNIFSGPDSLFFEWQHRDCHDLVGLEDCFGVPWTDFIGYGRPFRSYEFEDIASVSEVMMKEFAVNPETREYGELFQTALSQRSARFLGLKIGGLPSCTGEDNPIDWGNTSPKEIESLRYLCGFGSFCPTSGIPFPWVNRRDPLRRVSKGEYLNWYDGFQVSIFLDSKNRIRWIYQHY